MSWWAFGSLWQESDRHMVMPESLDSSEVLA